MNPDFRIKVGMTNHRKTRLLQRVVGGPYVRLGDHAVMCLIRLWEYATEHRIDGILSGLTNDEIEAEAEWCGERGGLIKALRTCKWISRHGAAWKLHQWEEHQPFVAGEPERREINAFNAHKRWHSKRPNGKCKWCGGAEPPHAVRMRAECPVASTTTATTTATTTGIGERERTATAASAHTRDAVNDRTKNMLRADAAKILADPALQVMRLKAPDDYETAVVGRKGWSANEMAEVLGIEELRAYRRPRKVSA